MNVVSLCDYRKDQQVEAVAAAVACFKLHEPWPPSRPAMERACRSHARELIDKYGYPPSRPYIFGPIASEA